MNIQVLKQWMSEYLASGNGVLWRKEYENTFNKVQEIKTKLEAGYKLTADNDEEFLSELLKDTKNGVASKGQSNLANKVFEQMIRNKKFLENVEQLILHPNAENYKLLHQFGSQLLEQLGSTNRPLLFNRASASCTLDVSTVVDEKKFNELVNYLQKQKIIDFTEEIKQKNWYEQNIYLVKKIREVFENEIKIKIIDIFQLNMFLWDIYAEKVSGGFHAQNAVDYLKKRYPNTYSGTVHIAAFKTIKGREIALDPKSKTPVIICDTYPPHELNLAVKGQYSENDPRHNHLSTHAKTLQVGNKAYSVIITNLNELEIFCEWYEGNLNTDTMNKFNKKNKEIIVIKKDLNRILFGSAGTGKTYNTINHALSILDPEILETNLERKDLKDRFDELRQEGRIKFVTFHQSFSYEDFVEGIRAESDEQGNLKYKVEAGVFKELCEQALGNTNSNIQNNFDLDGKNIWKMSLGRAGIEDDIYRSCLENDVILLGWGNAADFTNCNDVDSIKTKLSECLYPKEEENTAASYVNIFKNKIKEGDIVVITDGNLKFRAIAEVTGLYEYDDNKEFGYHQTRKVRWLKSFTPSLKNEDYFKKIFSQSTVYNLENAIDRNKLEKLLKPEIKNISNLDNKYVLIIDEINRGNISRIFGELITLIEDSKREGADEELSVTLPYSKKEFSVPKNVYIIGTMNSSDRSLTGLDIALRRRFTFIEMPPKPELLREIFIEGVNIGDLLEVMNQRIEVLLDRDHCLGHANFMSLSKDSKLDDLVQIFKQKIIPQLQEYFFDDWEKISLVLFNNDMIVENTEINVANLFPSNSENEYFEQKKMWKLNEDAFTTIDSFKRILGNFKKAE